MLEINVKKIDFDKKNTIISRVVNLDTHLDLIILLSVKDKNFGDLFLNKVLDSIIDKVCLKTTYKDFSVALENINAFISTWKNENEEFKWIHAIVWIIEKKSLLFSTLGSASCYLINNHNDVIEITEKDENKKDFGFILNGDVNDNEIILFWTTRILDYLSKWDIIDGARLDEIEWFNSNIKTILKIEKPKKNIGIISFRNNKSYEEKGETYLSKITYKGMQFLDNNFSKTILAYAILLKKKILIQSKQMKNLLLLWWMVICFIFLYTILSSVVNISSGVRDTESSKETLLKAREYVRLASENISNPDAFSLDIEKWEELAHEIQKKELFLNDVSKILDDISVLKKQFNGIETFTITEENTFFASKKMEQPVKILSVQDKVFLVDKKSIIWPIIFGQEPEIYPFDKFTDGDYFIDATVQKTDIVLFTSLGKVVNFAKNNFYSYMDVKDQPTWEQSNIIASYASNIYLLGKMRDQIFRHKKVAGKYEAGVPYLKEEDSKTIGTILSMAIDWGIYILKKDLSLVKLFVSPKYRLESIVLNKLPKNYNRENKDTEVSIYTAKNLNYFYMLLDNRVLIFQPNTTRYQNVKSMKYLWQVEARDFKIQNFLVVNDGEIFLLWKNWLYKMKFEVSDDKLIVR